MLLTAMPNGLDPAMQRTYARYFSRFVDAYKVNESVPCGIKATQHREALHACAFTYPHACTQAHMVRNVGIWGAQHVTSRTWRRHVGAHVLIRIKCRWACICLCACTNACIHAQAHGIDIWGVTVQNEAEAAEVGWEKCVYTPEFQVHTNASIVHACIKKGGYIPERR